jgi:quinohemoprotein amine dehydrogenase
MSLSAAAAPDAVQTYCSGCHHETAPGHFERISDIRKTPEGWTMTLFRMRQAHGLSLPEDVRDAIVRQLSDTQGLAPSESAAGRFALERRPNVKDIDLGVETNTMCGRCHSIARSALQRRDEAEWLKLANMHLGQWPSLEYQASSRDRPWWTIASGKMPAELAARWGFNSAAWTQWRSQPHRSLAGRWVVYSHAAGSDDYYGILTITQTADGEYRSHYDLHDQNNRVVTGDSHAIVYTGYEWRGTAQFEGYTLREVYAANEDGSRLTGRWFDADHSESGGDLIAVREDAAPEVLAVLPHAIKVGYTGPVTLIGPGLAKAPIATFGAGVSVGRITPTEGALITEVRVEDAAPIAAHMVVVGAARATLPIYQTIDGLSVYPAFAIARLGGGHTPPVTAQFEAVGSTKLADGTELSLGPVAAQWSSEGFDEDARRAADNRYAGHLDNNGQYHPASAGPNKDREFSGNNVGNLTVRAVAKDNAAVSADAHLIVTVQRWNSPPIY